MAARFFRDHVFVEETGSTNADVAARAREGAPEGFVLVADHQTAGRGRLDRTWTAPKGSGLAISCLLRPSGVPANRWSLLPLVIGVGVASGLRDVAGLDVTLKWPNDVLVDGKKLGGILIERVDTPSGAAAVVGVGLNVGMRAHELPVPTAISLVVAGAACTDRNQVLRVVLESIAAHYVPWRDSGGEPGDVLVSYRRLCATLGNPVSVQLPDGDAIQGRAHDIDDTGSLVIATPAGPHVVTAGDVVHLRPSPGS